MAGINCFLCVVTSWKSQAGTKNARWGSPASCSRQEIVQGHAESSFENPRGGRQHSLSGKPATLFDHPRGEEYVVRIV